MYYNIVADYEYTHYTMYTEYVTTALTLTISKNCLNHQLTPHDIYVSHKKLPQLHTPADHSLQEKQNLSAAKQDSNITFLYKNTW